MAVSSGYLRLPALPSPGLAQALCFCSLRPTGRRQVRQQKEPPPDTRTRLPRPTAGSPWSAQPLLGARVVPDRLGLAGVWARCAHRSGNASGTEEAAARRERRRCGALHRPRRPEAAPGRGGAEGGREAVPSWRLTRRAGGAAEVRRRRRRRRRKWLSVWAKMVSAGWRPRCCREGVVLQWGGPGRTGARAPVCPTPPLGPWGPRERRLLGGGRWGRAESWGSGRRHAGPEASLVVPPTLCGPVFARHPCGRPGQGRREGCVAALNPFSWESGGGGGGQTESPGNCQPPAARGFVRRSRHDSSGGGKSLVDSGSVTA